MKPVTLMERAFDLATSGDCKTIAEIKTRLKEERYSSIDQHLAGKFTKQQLHAAIEKAAA